MPDNTREALHSSQSFTLGDRKFIGIDTNLPPNMLDVGYLQDVNNLFVDGVALSPRPGWQAQLTSTLANPIYAITPYRTADGSDNRLFFVSGTSAYVHAAGSSVATALTGTATWTDASQVRFKQHGKYLYGVPGKDGTAVFRINGSLSTPVVETIPRLSAPTVDGQTYVKPRAVATPVKAKTIGTQVRTILATINSGSSTFTANNSYAVNDTVTVAKSIGTNFIAGTTYYVRSGVTSTTFTLASNAGGGAISNTSGANATVNVVKIDNEIDDYYTYKGLADYSTTGTSPWPTTWSDTLLKTRTVSTTVFSTGDFDCYDNNEQLGGADPIASDYTGSGASTRRFESYRWVQNGALFVKPHPSFVKYGTTAFNCIQLDNPGEYIEQIIQHLPSEQFSPATAATKMGLYMFSFYAFNNMQQYDQPCKFTVTIYGQNNDGDLPGAVISRTYTLSASATASDWQRRDIVVDFREFASKLTKIRFRFTNVGTVSNQWLYITRIRLYAMAPNMSASLENTETVDPNGLNVVRAIQGNPSLSGLNATYLRNRRLRIFCKTDAGAALDISKYSTLSFQWAWDKSMKAADQTYPLVTLGLQATGSTTITWSSLGEYDQENRYMTFKLYDLTQAEKTNIEYLYIQFQNDVFVENVSLNTSDAGITGQALFAIGNMTYDGGLSDNGLYEYAFSRWYPSSGSENPPTLLFADGTYAEGFESDISDVSDAIQTTNAIASATVILNPTNSAGYGSNIRIDKRALKIATDTTDKDQWVSTYVPGASQITIISTETSPSITYTRVNGTSTTVSGGSWVSTAAPDGTTYKKYDIPTPATNGIRFITALTGTGYWLEHYVPYGYGNTTQYSHVCVYRRNNNMFTDGRFRLIAVIPVNSTSPQTGDGWSATWNLATSREITFVDKVPDGNVMFETTPYAQGWLQEIGRDPLPTGCSSIATFQNRLWMSKANKVFGSWVLEQGNEYSIYTTELPDLNEPGVQKKGFTFSVGGQQEREVVQALLPVYSENIVQSNTTSATMLVLKESSVSTLIGFDPTTFNVQLWVSSPGVGISAPLSASNSDGQLVWLSVNGLVQWTGGGVANRSIQLRKLISLDPTMQGPSNIDATQYRKSICVTANQRLLLLSTSSGAGAANQTVYVFDGRTNGWVKWSTVSNIEFTSMGVMSFGDAIQYVYCGSTTGQLFRLAGTSDKTTTADTGTAIAWSLKTRQHGQTYAEGPSYYAYNKPYQLDVHLDNTNAETTSGGNNLVVSWAIDNQSGVYNVSTNPDGVSTSGTYNFATKTNRSVAIRNLGRDVKGTGLQVRLSGSSLGTFHIRGIHIHTYDGGIRR